MSVVRETVFVRIICVAGQVVFFLLLLAWLVGAVEPELIYHGGGVILDFPVFETDGAFAGPFFVRAGGPSEYVTAFLAQMFYHRWAGATVIFTLALVYAAGTGRLLRMTFGPKFRWLRWLAVPLILMPFNGYRYELPLVVSGAFAIGLLWFYLWLIEKRPRRAPLVVALGLAIAGWFAFESAVLLAALIAFYHLFKSSRIAGNLCSPSQARMTHLVVTAALVLLFSMLTVWISFDRLRKVVLKTDLLADRQDWAALLEIGGGYRQHFYVIHLVNRALCHLGRLGEEMFAWPQHYDALFLTDGSNAADWKRSDLYMELGALNKAEMTITEAMEKFGVREYLLKRQVLINMAQGQSEVAMVYLNALEKRLWHKRWARRYLKLLDEERVLEDATVRQLAANAIDDDYCFTSMAGSQMFAALLEKNKGNRMAAEYGVSLYLLTGKLGHFVKQAADMGADGLPMPAAWEQALLLYMSQNRGDRIVQGMRVRPEAIETYRGFSGLYRRFPTKEAGRETLAREFGDTYLFYYAYGYSGAKQ